MTRERISLDGEWRFLYDAAGRLTAAELTDEHPWRPIQVPVPWQAQYDDLHLSTGTGWYRLHFTPPAGWLAEDSAVVLHFGAVFYHAQVWLNGHELGAAEGGYFPLEYEIRARLRPGANTLLVRAIVPGEDHPDYPFSEILHGKQSWYGPWGGIWQPVWMERRPAVHVAHVQVQPDAEAQRVTCWIERSANGAAPGFRVQLIAPDGAPVAAQEGRITGHVQQVDLALTDAPLRWSPETPHLYRVRVTLSSGDALEKTCGFRTIEARDGQILLNGRPFYMRGALDQDYYPDTLSALPDVALVEEQMRQARAMGLNTLRYHIKIADPRYYEAADRIGLLLWVDLPGWTNLTDAVRSRVQAAFQQMLRRDHHHPSIAIWTIVNEDWGTDLVHNADHRAWLAQVFDWLKRADPGRLVVDNSACEPNFHVRSDIDDYHYYRAIPDHAEEWDAFVDDFAARAGFTYSPHGDAQRTYTEPLIVSEFGSWGLPDLESLLGEDGAAEPWWFETGHDWGEGIVYPHGVQDRFRYWHLDRVFGTLRALSKATQWQQYAALKYQIEAMRLRPEIQGYVITELTDLHWECNGLLDMRRGPRVFHERLADLNADVLVIPRADRLSCFSGETVTVALAVSQVGRPVARAVEWQVRGTAQRGVIPLPEASAAGGLCALPALSLPTPAFTRPMCLVLDLAAVDAAGHSLSRSHLEILVLPPVDAGPVTIRTDDGELAEQLAALGCTLAADAAAPGSGLRVQVKLDAALQAHVWAGGEALLLADPASGLPAYRSGVVIQQQFPYLSLSPRADTIWQGDWVSGFHWLRRRGPFADLPGGPLLGVPYAPVLPDSVLLGCGPRDFETGVMGGLFMGWVNRPAATVVQRRCGRGRVTVTTLNLLTPTQQGVPVARYLLDRLLQAPGG